MRQMRPGAAAWSGAPLLFSLFAGMLIAAAGAARAEIAPESLSARLAALPAKNQQAAADECAELALEIERDAGSSAHARAAALDRVRDACAQKLAWTDSVLVHLTERLVELRRPLAKQEPAPFCAALRALGISYDYLTRTGAARQAYEEALAVARRNRGRGTSDEDIATVLVLFSSLLSDLQQRHAALAAAGEALRLRRRLSPPQADKVIAALLARARIEETFNLQVAHDTLVEAHKLALTLGPEHYSVAGRTANNLGEVLYRMGDLRRAATALEEAERLRSGRLKGTHPERQLASTELQLGELSYDSGDYQKAEEYYRRAIDGFRDWLGAEPFRYCSALLDLATVLESSGRWEEAMTVVGETLAIREAAAHRQVPGSTGSADGALQLVLASSLTSLGELQERMGSAEAGTTLRRALAIEEHTLAGKADPVHAETLLALAAHWENAGDPVPARQAIGGCLRDLARLREQRPLLMRADGIAARLTEDARDGLRLTANARDLVRKLYGKGSPWMAPLLQTEAEIHLRQGDRPGALDRALDAQVRSLPQVRAVVQAFPRDQALAFAAERRHSVDLALEVLAEDPALARARAATTWAVAASSRMLVLNAEVDRRRLLHATSDPQLAAAARRLTAARQRFAYLVVQPQAAVAPHGAPLSAARRELQLAEAAFASKAKQLLPKGGTAAEVSMAALRRHLPAHAALVAFFSIRSRRQGNRYVAFVLNGGDPPCTVALGAAGEIDELTMRLHHTPSRIRGLAALRHYGEALRQAIWDPIARHLGDTRLVLIVPDGALYLVPWMALPVGSGRYLVEDGWAFQILTAERDLLTPEVAARPGPWLVVGGVDYDRAASRSSWAGQPGPGGTPDATVQSTSAAAVEPVTRQDWARQERALRGGAEEASADEARGGCAAKELPFFDALPASRQEVEDISLLWRQSQPQSANGGFTRLEGTNATKAAFRLAVPGQRLVHLATHGFAVGALCDTRRAAHGIGGLALGGGADSDQEPFAGLVLAGANDRARAASAEENGILTGDEILDLDLSAADWVVLSACDTGLGTVQAGEGVVGLLRSFQVAGARSVIVSLWPIDDDAARYWMRELYQARFAQHLSTLAAVRQATLHSLRHERQAGEVNPARWAGFIATGHWQ